MINGGMYTPSLYGNSAQYLEGTYTIPGGGKLAPARLGAGLSLSYDDGAGTSNLNGRKVNYYSTANLAGNTRLLTLGSVFVGIIGPRLLVFPRRVDWQIIGTPT